MLRSTRNDAAGQPRDPFNLGKIVQIEVSVAGGIQSRAAAEKRPNACGLLLHRRREAGVKGWAKRAVV